MNKYLAQTEKQEIKSWINTTLKKYLLKNPENVGEIEHIVDFLNSSAAPSRLGRMSYVQAKAGSEKWLKTQVKKGKNIEETDDDVKVIKRFKSGMRLVKLIGENAFKREGFLMSHCVASYVNKIETSVYSLRDKNNIPHCTIEVVGNSKEVNQIKGKGNGPIHPAYIKYILSILKTVFKMDVRDSEMSNLGYSIPPSGFEEFLKENDIKGAQFLKIKDKKFFYTHSKLE